MIEPVDWSEAFTKFHPRVVAYFYRRTSDQFLAEDLAAQTFVKAIEAERKGQYAQSSFSGWLYRIAHNLVIDHYRARSKKPTTIELDAPADMDSDGVPRTNGEMTVDGGLLPHEIAEKTAVGLTMRSCISSLQGNQARIIWMILDGFSYQEIALIYGCTEGAVKSQKNRAFQQLRLMMDREGNVVKRCTNGNLVWVILREICTSAALCRYQS
jgi:RNA polymerase sigma-70 factor (ECF subfamily)